MPDAEIATHADPVVGRWTFDGHTGDTSWFHRDAAARNDSPLLWTEDHKLNPNRAINLTGIQLIDTRGGQPLFTDRSYSLSVWVKIADTSRDQVVLAADGTHISPFYLEYQRGTQPTDGRWVFLMPATDTPSAAMQVTESTHAAVVGVWTHLVVVWNKGWGRAQLYVDNVLEATSRPSVSWKAPETGALHIGVAQSGNLIGAIDDLQVFQRTLTIAEIDRLYRS